MIGMKPEIEAHLQAWALWYACLREISQSATYPNETAKERAWMAAYHEWDAACCWLEAHGVNDEHIVYNEATKSCMVKLHPQRDTQ